MNILIVPLSLYMAVILRYIYYYVPTIWKFYILVHLNVSWLEGQAKDKLKINKNQYKILLRVQENNWAVVQEQDEGIYI